MAGKVVDASTGSPLADAVVLLDARAGPLAVSGGRELRTGRAGCFGADPLVLGDVEYVRIRAPGHSEDAWNLMGIATLEQEDCGFVFALQEAAVVEGVVRDENGTPLTQGEVRAFPTFLRSNLFDEPGDRFGAAE